MGAGGSSAGLLASAPPSVSPTSSVSAKLAITDVSVHQPCKVVTPGQGTPRTPKSLTAGTCAVVASEFQVLSLLGKGAYGEVHLVRRYKTGQIFAMKVLLKADMQEGDAQRIVDEGRAMAEIRHPFVVRLHFAFHDERHVYFVLTHYAGGDLGTFLDEDVGLDEEQCTIFVAEMALALEAVHAHGFVYRDLKPENLLLGTDGHLALADFGLAKKVKFGNALAARATTFCGTPAYMAPEQFLKESYGKSVDWWAVGLVFSEMLLGDLGLAVPFDNENYAIVLNSFRRGKHLKPLAPESSHRFSPAALDLRQRLLTVEPSRRICCAPSTVDDFKRHALFKGLDWDALARKAIPGPLLAWCADDATQKLSRRSRDSRGGEHSGDGRSSGSAATGGTAGSGKAPQDHMLGAQSSEAAQKRTTASVENRVLDELFQQFSAAPGEFGKDMSAETSETTWSTMLCDAASKNDTATLKDLIAHGAPVDACDYDKRTPMHLVCSEGCMAVLKLLVQHGADLNPVDRWGNTPLDDANRLGHADVAAWLKARGAEARRYLMDGSSNRGRIAAIRAGDAPAAGGATALAALTEEEGEALAPLLCEAAAKNDVEKLQELVRDHGVHPNYCDYDRRTALHLAASEGHLDAVRFLVDVAGADVNFQDRWANTAVDEARRANHIAVETFLLDRRGESGKYRQLLRAMKAASDGDLAVLQTLVAQNVDVSRKRKADGWTALHCAAARGHVAVVHYLCVDCSVNPVPRDAAGKTPFDMANVAKQTDIAAFLTNLVATKREEESSPRRDVSASSARGDALTKSPRLLDPLHITTKSPRLLDPLLLTTKSPRLLDPLLTTKSPRLLDPLLTKSPRLTPLTMKSPRRVATKTTTAKSPTSSSSPPPGAAAAAAASSSGSGDDANRSTTTTTAEGRLLGTNDAACEDGIIKLELPRLDEDRCEGDGDGGAVVAANEASKAPEEAAAAATAASRDEAGPAVMKRTPTPAPPSFLMGKTPKDTTLPEENQEDDDEALPEEKEKNDDDATGAVADPSSFDGRMSSSGSIRFEAAVITPVQSPSSQFCRKFMPPLSETADSSGAGLPDPAEPSRILTLCPLTKQRFLDPVVAADGYTYERADVVDFFRRYGPFSPITHADLDPTALVPNRMLAHVLAL